MRLNRVLQNKLSRVSLLAAIGTTMAAVVFTISCGEDGADGKNGGDCTITGAASPFTVICDGRTVGELNDGVNGIDGPQGDKGQAGKNGNSCVLEPTSGGSYNIVCGNVPKGVLNGCVIAQDPVNAYQVTIDCGETKAYLCNSIVFDAAKQICTSDGASAPEKGFCGLNKTVYNPETQYCGFSSATRVASKSPEVLPRCNRATMPSNDPTYPGYYTDDQPNRAARNDVYMAAGDSNFYYKGDSTVVWADEYCQVTRKMARKQTDTRGKYLALTSSNTLSDTTAAIKNAYFRDDSTVGTPSICGTSTTTKYNEGSWKGEYCGYANASSNTRSKLSNGCSNGELPDSAVLGRSYCQMRERTDKLTRLAVTKIDSGYCGNIVAILDPVATTNQLLKRYVTPNPAKLNTKSSFGPNSILSPSDFPNEYCGFNNYDQYKNTFATAKVTNNVASAMIMDSVVYLTKKTGLCDNGITISGAFSRGPDDWQQYMDSLYAMRLEYLAKRKEKGASASVADTAGSKENPGAAGLTAYRPLWQNRYCQFDATGKTSVAGGKNAYCVAITGANLAGPPVYDIDTLYRGSAGSKATLNKMNATKWNNEFCQYETLDAFNKKGSAVRKVATNQCTDPGIWGGASGNTKPNEVNHVDGLKYWPNEFCQSTAANATRLVGIAAIPGETANTLRWDTTGLAEYYCVKPPAGAGTEASDTTALVNATKATTEGGNGALVVYQSITGTNALKMTAQGQYCGYATKKDFDDGKVSTSTTTTRCADGLGPNELFHVRDFLGYWPNEYCQAQTSAGHLTKRVGILLAFLDGSITFDGSNPYTAATAGSFTGQSKLPTQDAGRGGTILSVFCPSDTTTRFASLGKAATAADTVAKYLATWQAANKLNEKSWKSGGEYCGFSNMGNASTVTTGTTPKAKDQVFSVLKGYCTKGTILKAPNAAVGYMGTWLNEYCQADRDNLTELVGGPGAYCMNDAPEKYAAQTSDTYRLNKDKWNGDYCFDDNVKGQCTGGWVKIDGAYSTSVPRCQVPLE